MSLGFLVRRLYWIGHGVLNSRDGDEFCCCALSVLPGKVVLCTHDNTVPPDYGNCMLISKFLYLYLLIVRLVQFVIWASPAGIWGLLLGTFSAVTALDQAVDDGDQY